jgi:hypothetical protein
MQALAIFLIAKSSLLWSRWIHCWLSLVSLGLIPADNLIFEARICKLSGCSRILVDGHADSARACQLPCEVPPEAAPGMLQWLASLGRVRRLGLEEG